MAKFLQYILTKKEVMEDYEGFDNIFLKMCMCMYKTIMGQKDKCQNVNSLFFSGLLDPID